MYYVLSYIVPQDEDGGYYDVEDGIEIDGVLSWSLGARWDAVVPDPIEIELVPVDGYSGPPSDMYDGNVCLMSARLVDALRAAGVDNLDVYPAVLRDTESGVTYDFRAVNIIGLVAAADLSMSEWTSFDGDALIDTNFDRLEINERATRNLSMFRMAENTGVILIHERVRDHLSAQEFHSLIYADPGHWVS